MQKETRPDGLYTSNQEAEQALVSHLEEIQDSLGEVTVEYQLLEEECWKSYTSTVDLTELNIQLVILNKTINEQSGNPYQSPGFRPEEVSVGMIFTSTKEMQENPLLYAAVVEKVAEIVKNYFNEAQIDTNSLLTPVSIFLDAAYQLGIAPSRISIGGVKPGLPLNPNESKRLLDKSFKLYQAQLQLAEH